ncbi:uncharacterized protein Z520_02793 [Fonsecaea multimorphosa CBS 102226]|uniref:Uncharacterized protein n=1 Tax=Fonsecaea multimorphosa CBS 102226 TaxID=1442371 RepID=A0A0D2HH34_9EURO|nr:uncharacterized protein Z520_02793 [Fonsecaea multimorphosa CBS 102226]KIY01241.1 hypothetical protein Z520_02793 [Fonsecaea multimorphosa CBS 102226]OAL28521.1 hypothetical protein AYO22_02715 [Fonsecaea multimorphosa]
MPKGPKSIAVLCAELGMDGVAESNLRKDAQSYLKAHVEDLPNAPDSAIEPVAWTFLESGGGSRHFSWDAALNYQWEASEHRSTILHYVTEIMKMQRWYIIDRLHKRTNGAVNCPGCLLHSPKQGTPETVDGVATVSHVPVDDTDSSNESDMGSIHDDSGRDDGLSASESRKRHRASRDRYSGAEKKRRKSSGPQEEAGGTVGTLREETQLRTTSIYNVVPNPRPSTNSNAHAGFTPVNPTVVVEIQRAASKPEAQAQPSSTQLASSSSQTLTLKDFNLSMRYRGKQWHFNSIAHKARVLEQILLQEEKDVESYPIVAFSKGAKKVTLGGDLGNDPDPDGDERALKDYFRFYSHFMNDRFPGNEKLLLENGVRPSA